MKDLFDAFDAIYVINLDHRADRLNSFIEQMKMAGASMELIHSKVQRFSGIIPPNKNGALGCIMSHISIIREAKRAGHKNVLVFEDDMMFVGNSFDLTKICFQLSSKKWDLFYLGYNSHEQLTQVDSNLLKIKNCFSTHAIAYNHTIYDYIISAYDAGSINILDVWLRDKVQSDFTCLGAYPIQCSQIAGKSDIQNSFVDYSFIMDRFRNNTRNISASEKISQDLIVSICIPTYEMFGNGADYLNFSINKLYEQTYKNIEIVISDQANDSSIENVCLAWSDKIKITYSKEPNRGKSSANINNAMQLASGHLIKILFQDDFIYGQTVLEDIVKLHKQNNKKWYVSACIHTNDGNNFYRKIVPSYHKDIHYGKNTIGAPSVITYVNSKDFVRFDDSLIWLMDCEYYKRMYDRHGQPFIISNEQIAIRTWENTYSNLINENTKKSEYEYIKRKYRNQ